MAKDKHKAAALELLQERGLGAAPPEPDATSAVASVGDHGGDDPMSRHTVPLWRLGSFRGPDGSRLGTEVEAAGIAPAQGSLRAQRNWYLPGWLQWLPHFEPEEPSSAAEANPVSATA